MFTLRDRGSKPIATMLGTIMSVYESTLTLTATSRDVNGSLGRHLRPVRKHRVPVEPKSERRLPLQAWSLGEALRLQRVLA
jgi:hypothetical protein